jgi:hypothetical protein
LQSLIKLLTILLSAIPLFGVATMVWLDICHTLIFRVV